MDLDYQKKTTVFFNCFVSAALLIIVAIYFVQINQVVDKNFRLADFRDSLKEKQTQSQNLTNAVLEARSLKELEAKAKDLSLVGVDKIKYLEINSDSFAFLPTQ